MVSPASVFEKYRRNAIKTVDMHTTGEPTRIVVSGFPDLEGTLLEQREELTRNMMEYVRG